MSETHRCRYPEQRSGRGFARVKTSSIAPFGDFFESNASPQRPANVPPTDSLANDLLRGAKAIAAFIGIDGRRCYYALEHGYIPATKEGETWVAAKSVLRRYYGISAHAPASADVGSAKFAPSSAVTTECFADRPALSRSSTS